MTTENDQENIDRISTALLANDLDALLCSLPSHVLLLTGYEPVIGDTVALFTRSDGVYLLIPEDEAEMAEETSTANRVTFKPASLERITNSKKAIAPHLQALLTRLRMEHARVGFELYSGQHSASYLSQYRYGDSLVSIVAGEFPSVRIMSADQLLHRLCSVKTKQQVQRMRISCNLAETAFERAAKSWQIGMSEPEVADSFQSAYGRAAAEQKIPRTTSHFFCMSGPNAEKAYAAFAMTRCRKICEGDTVMIHCNSNVNGYWTDITRTYIRGDLSPRHTEMMKAINEARSVGIDTIAPGVAASKVDAKVRDVLTKYGFGEAFKHATGHGVGFGPASHNAIPRIHPKSSDVLEQGMTFNIEPAIYLEGFGGIRHCDVMALHERGTEILTDFQSSEKDLCLPS